MAIQQANAAAAEAMRHIREEAAARQSTAVAAAEDRVRDEEAQRAAEAAARAAQTAKREREEAVSRERALSDNVVKALNRELNELREQLQTAA